MFGLHFFHIVDQLISHSTFTYIVISVILLRVCVGRRRRRRRCRRRHHPNDGVFVSLFGKTVDEDVCFFLHRSSVSCLLRSMFVHVVMMLHDADARLNVYSRRRCARNVGSMFAFILEVYS